MKSFKQVLLASALFASTSALLAADLSFAFEGDAAKRERLAELQGTATPPALHLKDWQNSEALKLGDLKGKIVVLDFWATWCGPCIRSIPHNNELAEKYKDDVVIIAICAPKGGEKMKAMVKDKGIEYPVAIDVDAQTKNAYGANGYPDYYIIDRDGSLVVADCQNSKVEDVLKVLLAK